jgi:hypothetical protein
MKTFRVWLEGKAMKGWMLPTPENIALAKQFVFEKWKERAKEYGHEEPADLQSACKFASIFAQRIFGGQLRGNYDHQWVDLNGQVIDLADYIADDMENVYLHDRGFWGNKDHKESMASCEPRVARWVQEFKARYKGA